MTVKRLYIFGASGSGTTTLGSEIAASLSLPHVDCDDHYWEPSDVPFSQKRPPAARVLSMKQALGRDGWVLSGSCNSWGAEVVEQAQFLVFVTAPTEVRLKRLAQREAERFGDRIKEGGDMHLIHKGFLAWASEYDTSDFNGRSRSQHEIWIQEQSRLVCRIDGCQPVEASLQRVHDFMSRV